MRENFQTLKKTQIPHGREEVLKILLNDRLIKDCPNIGFEIRIRVISDGNSASRKSLDRCSDTTGFETSWVAIENVHPFFDAYLINFTRRIDEPAEPSGGKYREIANTCATLF